VRLLGYTTSSAVESWQAGVVERVGPGEFRYSKQPINHWQNTHLTTDKSKWGFPFIWNDSRPEIHLDPTCSYMQQLFGNIIPNINHELLRIDEDWFLPNSGLSCSCFAPPSGLQSRRPGTPVTFCSKLVAERCRVEDAPVSVEGLMFHQPEMIQKHLKTIDKVAWKHQVIGILAVFSLRM